jgi:hypothetical protein
MIMRKDDWITKLYYENLSDKSRNYKHPGEVISNKKKIPSTQNQLRKR